MLMLACLFLCLSQAQAGPLRVHVLLSERGGAYQEFDESLRKALQGGAIELSSGDTSEKIPDSALVVAVGMRSSSAMLGSKTPVLSVLVPKSGYDRLEKRELSQPLSAIYLDQPIERQLSFLTATLPDVQQVGLLYASLPPELVVLRHLVAERKLHLHERALARGEALSEALDDVLRQSEVLLVVPDADIYNAGTVRNILLASYRKHIPLIGISQSYVKAGALCAIYSTPEQIALQTGEVVRQFSSSGKLPASQYPREFEVSVNIQVARSLNLKIKDAEELRNEVRRKP